MIFSLQYQYVSKQKRNEKKVKKPTMGYCLIEHLISSNILFEIKSNLLCAPVRFWNHAYDDFRPNYTALNSVSFVNSQLQNYKKRMAIIKEIWYFELKSERVD